MTLTNRIKLLRKLVRKFTSVVSKDGKFKIIISLSITDLMKGITDLL
jgi:hypothetical protein